MSWSYDYIVLYLLKDHLLFIHHVIFIIQYYVKVTHISTSGKNTVLTYFPGIAIYRSTERRDVSIPLSVPDGVDLSAGRLRIEYMEQQREGSDLIASTMLKL